MNAFPPRPVLRGLMLSSGVLLGAVSCASRPPAEEQAERAASFARVRPVLEGSCVHCHGWQRLPGMPPLTDTKALAALTGPGQLIVPGHPDQSRFYAVMTLADNQTGAMPPTGHALSRKEVAALRTWIEEGAPVPFENSKLVPAGAVPRSR
jgi:mono/diheme cytochrome c family protein